MCLHRNFILSHSFSAGSLRVFHQQPSLSSACQTLRSSCFWECHSDAVWHVADRLLAQHQLMYAHLFSFYNLRSRRSRGLSQGKKYLQRFLPLRNKWARLFKPIKILNKAVSHKKVSVFVKLILISR